MNRSSPCGSAVKNPTSIYEDRCSIPGLAQWVKDLTLWWALVWVTDAAQILHCCGTGQQLSSDSTHSLGTAICCRGSSKKTKKKKKKSGQPKIQRLSFTQLTPSHLFFSFFFFFRATPAAHRGSQARGQIGAAAASLCQSHSNTTSEKHLWLTPQLMAMLDT